MKKKIIILANFTFISVIFIVLFLHSKKEQTTDLNLPDSFQKQIKYSFTLQNQTGESKKNVKFWTFAPVKNSASQSCKHIEATHPYHLIEDLFGNQILEFTFDNFPPFSTRIIRIKAEVSLSDISSSVSKVKNEKYLQAEDSIESNHTDIIHLAKSMEKTSAIATAEAVYNWIGNNIQYSGYMKDDMGALYAYRNRKGDCTEYMALFLALCRANKIPARAIGGYICADNCILNPSSFHNWAEFFDGRNWLIADALSKSFNQNSSNYIAMRIIDRKNTNYDFNRFKVQGDGVTARMNN